MPSIGPRHALGCATHWALLANVRGFYWAKSTFLMGKKFMSDGMQVVAGNSLRRAISIATNNRLFARLG